MKNMTYKKAGVDIEKASLFKKKIAALVKTSCGPLVLKGVGGFGSLFNFPGQEYRHPVLVSSTDGVGTKLKIALLARSHDTIGIDLVAMNVNDILCMGARPLFFLDYIATGKLDPQVLLDVVKGINRGCLQAGCALIGGETAEMPGMYPDGEYDVAGFCVGVVDRERIIDGSRIRPGNVVIGLESSGIHSNGYALVRKVLSRNELLRMSDELLKPTRIYVKPVLSILREYDVKGISHITGGAFYDKIARILPGDTDVLIRKHAWAVPKIFRLIQNKGGIDEKQMYHTFNMGIGMVLIADAGDVSGIRKSLLGSGLKSWVIGEAAKGSKAVTVA
ncbi:MAG TPA: phosphoribosylformylglycinamidine cyclo-ligase [Patescibacteria group bacterium]|nr:phosphoribosylformylglycinamidine cyclo-ligase [Patescibacteria group bacterium]